MSRLTRQYNTSRTDSSTGGESRAAPRTEGPSGLLRPSGDPAKVNGGRSRELPVSAGQVATMPVEVTANGSTSFLHNTIWRRLDDMGMLGSEVRSSKKSSADGLPRGGRAH